MFQNGSRVVSSNAPKNPSMASCPDNLVPASAYWLRGEVVSDNGEVLTLKNVERNSFVSGGSSSSFGSGSAWYRSAQEDGLVLPSRTFKDDSNLKVSSINQPVL